MGRSGLISIFLSFLLPATHTIAMRTIATAVNIEMMMPRPMVIAKPRTGPEPNQNSRTVAISVVTLLSTMVE